MVIEDLNHDRRYDIDWLRVISISFLLIYHIVLMYQPWGFYIGFIQSPETNESIWIPMALLNVWRIPLLFFVSGMGVCFALRKRDWKELLKDRALRILLPLLFGSFLIVPVHQLIFAIYYNQEFGFSPNVGHLWFLLNICIYVTQVIGFAFLDQKYDYKFYNVVRSVLKRPYFIYLFYVPFILEAVLINPQYFSLYVGTTHGFILGMIAFFFGFQFIAIGEAFWNSVKKLWHINLFIAFGLYLIRLVYFDLNAPNLLTSIESIMTLATVTFCFLSVSSPPPSVAVHVNVVLPRL